MRQIEPSSWCWSNDQCLVWDVTYDNFGSLAPMAMSTCSKTTSANVVASR